MSLETYRKKRDFGRTSEPLGKTRRTSRPHELAFVVQKHHARRLHYDLRLELDGVLKSWAIPKGPSLDPSVKRLAVETEDHPIEYGAFEGVIPEGEYGAGPVVVWDRGYWRPEGDPNQAYAKGHLSFTLEGQKLHGHFHLVRTKAGDKKGKSWLLIKGKDANVEHGAAAEITEQLPQSALSGRRIQDVAEDPDRIWHSHKKAGKTAKAKASPRMKPTPLPDPSRYDAARKAPLPGFIDPQLATLVDQAPLGDDWLHELKLDGYRMQMRLDHGKVKAFTRRGHDWASRMPSIASELSKLSAAIGAAVLDGELVVLRDGLSDFQRLQNSLSEKRDGDCVFYAFDLLYLNGFDLQPLALRDRKELLRETLAAANLGKNSRIRFSDHVIGKGREVFERACQLKAEGSIAKRADAPYKSGRNKSWLKIKCRLRQEFVIGGFTNPGGTRAHLGALMIGVMNDAGELEYAGKIGTGFSERSLRELHEKLLPLERDKPAFVNPPRGAEGRDARWVKPQLVAEIEYAERTSDGHVRHGSFLGLREDKPAKQVHDEKALSVPQPGAANAKKKAGAKAAKKAPALPEELRSVRMTHPERVLFPDIHVTKAELALYYAQVSERMLPLVAKRPLMLVRCPEGVNGDCFHQKHPTQGMSPLIRRLKIKERKGTFETIYVENAGGLVQLVQNGALEIHSWGSRADDVERPDQLTFDLDPDEALPWPRMVEAALEIKGRLSALDLPTFLKTTGGKGLHIVVPIKPSLNWDEIKSLTKAFADSMTRAQPAKYLATISKAQRRGKILIDYLRNGRGATAVCAYSTRARARAPVALPIAWDELTEDLRPDQFTIKNVPEHLASVDDPWADFERERARLTRAMQRGMSK